MPIKILMPALSPTMEHGLLAKWLKKEGDVIKAGDVIAEIETDKATMEVEAVDEGVLAKILVKEGAQEVPINSLIALLLEEGEDPAVIEGFIAKSSFKPQSNGQSESLSKEQVIALDAKQLQQSDQVEQAPEEKIDNRVVLNEHKQIIDQIEDSNIRNGRMFASPLAKRIASMEGINLMNIVGSGPGGRVVKADVLSASRSVSDSTTIGKIVRNHNEYRNLPNNNIRKIIAKRLLESKLTIPHFYLSIECVMDNVLLAREQVNQTFGDDKSRKLSVNDFIILATAKALKDVPSANASWSDEAIRIYNNVDISVAVAIDDGLITPVITNADQKDIKKISAEMKDLAKRARENRLKPEEFQGGGFTISNLGMYGIKNFSAIINPPQCCILAVGMSDKRVVVIDNKMEIRTMMDVNLSCDHRVVDGAVGAQFLAAFKRYIESPILMFI